MAVEASLVDRQVGRARRSLVQFDPLGLATGAPSP
jgi:hypothetical protein